VSSLPRITEKAIRDRVGDRSFEMGRDYARADAVFDTRQQGATIKGRCQGTAEAPYHVRVTFDDDGVASADCSCPVGGGGLCKHVAALLLAWRKHPEAFVEVAPLPEALDRLGKKDLITLIINLAHRRPDLEALLETTLSPGASPCASADPDVYRREADDAFRRVGHGPGATADVVDQLEVLVQNAEGCLRDGDTAAATALYSGVSRSVMDHYDDARAGEDEYEEDHLARFLTSCAEGLGRCLRAAAPAAPERAKVLDALWEITRFDLRGGEGDIVAAVPRLLAEPATPEERRGFADRARASLPARKPGDTGADWLLRPYGDLIFAVEGDLLTDAEYLKVCRQTGKRVELLERLLQLGRVDEAVREAAAVDDERLPELADVLVRHGEAVKAERLVKERLADTKDADLPRWLEARTLERGDTAAALPLARQVFKLEPGLETFRTVRRLATENGRWEKERPALLSQLDAPQFHDLRVQAYLDEGDLDAALAAVKKERVPRYGQSMALRVAEAAEAERPREALALYCKHAEGLIGMQGRERYREAAGLLRKVKDLYSRLGEAGEWTRNVAALREKYKRQRAFLEELRAAGL
jgi:hypothetical protein